MLIKVCGFSRGFPQKLWYKSKPHKPSPSQGPEDDLRSVTRVFSCHVRYYFRLEGGTGELTVTLCISLSLYGVDDSFISWLLIWLRGPQPPPPSKTSPKNVRPRLTDDVSSVSCSDSWITHVEDTFQDTYIYTFTR